MKFSLVAVVCVLMLLYCTRETSGQIFSTIIFPEGIDGANPIISAVENTENVTFFCEVFRISDGVQRQTAWTLINDSVILFTPEGLGQTGFENYVVSPETFRTNITILEFDETFDNNQIGCGAGDEIVSRFDLRIIKPPVLLQNSTPIAIIEGYSFSFYIEQTEGFPIVPDDYEWSFDGTPISEGGSNPNISIYPVIIFTNVNRTDSGNYSITVSNEGGTSTGFIILNVQYSPEGVPQTGPFYVVTGDDITITAYTNIDGNPNPTSNWTKDNSPVTDGGRFNTSVPGQLTITTVISSDAGNYTNTLTNGVLISINNTIELIVSVPPSMPRNVTVLGDPEPESVVLSWLNPNTIGSPVFSLFNVFIYTTTEGISNITRQVTPNNTIDTDYNNTVTINGLKPNIQYTVTITTISYVEQLGEVPSDSSEEVVFSTSSGAPDFLSTVLTNVNGNLSVTWYFRHTGGVGLETVTVNCGEVDDYDSSGDNPLSIIIYCTSMSDCDGRSVSLGPVIAGVNYCCLVTADNNIGEDEMRTNYLITDTGIPSLPVVNNVTGGSGVVILLIQVSYSGVINSADFYFIIFIYNENDQLFANRTINADSQYFTGSLMNAVITVNLEEGMYSFTVQSSNPYGMSEVTELTDEVVVDPTPTTSITTTTTISTGPSTTTTSISTTTTMTSSTSGTSTTSPGTPTSTGGQSGISGGAIAGIVIAIIILVAIIAIVVLIVFYIVYKTKGGSYEVEGGGGGGGKKGVKVEELDIDIGTELQESTPLRDPTKEPTEKTELHYADLAQFHQPKSTPKQQQPPTKPTPIEEVQYAQIRPQDISQTSGGDEDMPPTSSDIL